MRTVCARRVCRWRSFPRVSSGGGKISHNGDPRTASPNASICPIRPYCAFLGNTLRMRHAATFSYPCRSPLQGWPDMRLIQRMSWGSRRVRCDERRRHVTGLQKDASLRCGAFYLPLGETFHSSFSTLTPDKDPHSNAAIYGRPTDEPVANFGG